MVTFVLCGTFHWTGDAKPHSATVAPRLGGMRRDLHQVSRGHRRQPRLPYGEYHLAMAPWRLRLTF